VDKYLLVVHGDAADIAKVSAVIGIAEVQEVT